MILLWPTHAVPAGNTDADAGSSLNFARAGIVDHELGNTHESLRFISLAQDHSI